MLLELFEERVEKVRSLFEENGADALLISKCNNFSWFTFGARSHITLNATEGEASILVTPDGVYLLINNIELQRLKDLELPREIQQELKVVEYDWFERTSAEKRAIDSIVKGKVISDTGRYDTGTVDLVSLRSVLSDYEVGFYSDLGRECDEIFSDVVPSFTPDMTELEVQGIMYREMAKRDIEPVLTLAFSEESTLTYRHNLSRNTKLTRRGFVSICARRRGLIISSSRSFMFEEVEGIREQHRCNCYVDSVAIVSSRPEEKLSDVFEKIKEAYATQEAPGEWRFHHQGGLAGYSPREVVADPYTSVVLKSGNSLAWNPTIRGTKSEDTVVLLAGQNRIVSYPQSSRWPALIFEIGGQTVRRPNIVLLK
jgi:hypothetical protein